jgi:hypothetical protein
LAKCPPALNTICNPSFKTQGYAKFLEKNIHTIIDPAISSDILLLSPESRKRGIAYNIEGWWTFGQQMLRNFGSFLAFSD